MDTWFRHGGVIRHRLHIDVAGYLYHVLYQGRMMKSSQILQASLDKLEDGSRWTKGCSARDVGGTPTGSKRPDAYSWCMAGAISSLTNSCKEQSKAMEWIRYFLVDSSIVRFNDDVDRTWPEVKDVLIKAITAAQADEANQTTEGNK